MMRNNFDLFPCNYKNVPVYAMIYGEKWEENEELRSHDVMMEVDDAGSLVHD